MSLPTFPTVSPPLTTKDSLNMILTSIAMEEAGLSHIINAEGEKLQYVLGTLEGKCREKASVEEILAVNKSVKCLLDSVSQNQMILKGKMECAVDALKQCGCKPDTEGRAPCRAAVFPGYSDYSRYAGQPLKWQNTKCSDNCSFCLSDDCEKIRLEKNKCYSVSFSIDLCPAECKNLSISVRTCGCKTLDRFIYHTPVYGPGAFTASASGIYVETCNCGCTADLMLTVLSPDAIRVNRSSIFITEIS